MRLTAKCGKVKLQWLRCYALTYFFCTTNDTKYDGVFVHCVYCCNNSCISSFVAQIFKKTIACYLVRIHSTWMGKSSTSLQVSNTFPCTLHPTYLEPEGKLKKIPGKSKFELTNHEGNEGHEGKKFIMKTKKCFIIHFWGSLHINIGCTWSKGCVTSWVGKKGTHKFLLRHM